MEVYSLALYLLVHFYLRDAHKADSSDVWPSEIYSLGQMEPSSPMRMTSHSWAREQQGEAAAQRGGGRWSWCAAATVAALGELPAAVSAGCGMCRAAQLALGVNQGCLLALRAPPYMWQLLPGAFTCVLPAPLPRLCRRARAQGVPAVHAAAPAAAPGAAGGAGGGVCRLPGPPRRCAGGAGHLALRLARQGAAAGHDLGAGAGQAGAAAAVRVGGVGGQGWAGKGWW